jgi:hypothetical protein
MRRSPFAFILLIPLLATPVRAQLRDSLAVGTRIRVTLTPRPLRLEGATAAQQLRGALSAYSADSLTLDLHPGVAPVTLAWPVVRRIERSRGVSRLESALHLGLLGALQGMLEFAAWESADGDDVFGSTGKAFLWGGVTGGGLGIVIGTVRPHERWKRIRLERR